MVPAVPRVALIPGGARGIGRAIGLDLAARGWSVALAYRTSRDDAQRTAAEIRERGVQALAVEADVSDPATCQQLVERTRTELGPIDALIQCAGPYRRGPLLSESPEQWTAMFDNNLHPLFYLARAVAPGMIERRTGRILGFAMANADRMLAQPDVCSHYISKAGVLILVRTLAKVLGPHGITANCISPGFIDSGSAPPEELARMLKAIPAGYIGALDDCVAAARFLLSDEARYVNGANLVVSGGWGV